MIKLSDFCYIYTAESHALKIVKQQKIDRALILRDSRSVLNSIRNIKQPNTISTIIQIRFLYYIVTIKSLRFRYTETVAIPLVFFTNKTQRN